MDEYEPETIEVTGINQNTSEETLDDYFSGSKRGGDIKRIDYTRGSGVAFIIFDHAEGAKKALETRAHSLEGCSLTVRRKKVEVSETDKIYVEGISAKATRECVLLYIELISDGLDVKDITYGAEDNQSCNAIITFQTTMDYDKIREGLKRKPTLEKQVISIKPVPLCATILVKNLPKSATHDSVLFKCESKKAGGGEVERVDLDLEKRIALVHFKDPTVIDRILSREQTLDSSILTLQRYYPILGNLADLQTQQETSCGSETPDRPTCVKADRSKATAFTKEIDRDLYSYLKEHHPANLSLALKDPQPNIEERTDSVHFTFSNQDAKDHFLTLLKEYTYEIIPINPVLLKHGLSEEITGITQIFSFGKSVVFVEKYNEGFIKLVGRAVQAFNRAMEEVKKCIDKVEKAYEKITSNREDTIEILPVHIKFLRKSTKFVRLESSLKQEGFETKLDDTMGKITVKGSPTQIQNFKVEIQQIVGHFGERSLNQSKFSILNSNKAICHVKTLLSTENSAVEVSVDDEGKVMLYGLVETEVEQAYSIIVSAIGEFKLPQRLRTKQSQDALLKELGPSIPLAVDTENSEPRIICFKKDLRNLTGKVDDFLEKNKTVEVRVPLAKVILRYLDLHGQTILDGLRLSSPRLAIEKSTDALVVSGEKSLVENCCASIQQFIGGLKSENMNYGTPETSASIKGATAMAMIQNIERKHQCAILVTTKEETERASSFRTTPTSPVHNLNAEDRKKTMQCRYTFPNGKIIEVHQGDILNHPVDYLVNSANDELKHAGGLAKAIVDKGGYKIQEDSFRAMQDQGREKLLPGEVVTTDGGKLLCKKVLHVVVPKCSSRDSGHVNSEEETREGLYLRHACGNVLEKVIDGQTIAIPALGTGIYEVPFDVSAGSLVTATIEFLQENPSHSLREVHFVDNNPAAIEALMKEMITRFGFGFNFHINELVRDRWNDRGRSSPGAASVAPRSTSAVVSGDMAFKTPEGMEIRLTVGNIAKSTTDVIVNTVSNDLDLTKNPCSKAILDEAGANMTTYCEKWIKQYGQVKEGDFATTDSGKLKCKKVLHVSCPKWTADHGEKKLRELVQKLLNKVHSIPLTSISIPALGTGTLQFPEVLVAKVLFEEAMKFSSKHSSSLKIKQVNIVVYSGNAKAVNTFKEQYQTYSVEKIDTNIPKTKRRIWPTMRKTQPKEKAESPEDDSHGVKVEIVEGNIVQETTDAIGFLVAEDITQGGQIGTALLKAAGASLVQEYSKLAKIEAGTTVMTIAGNLRARYLLHMVVKDNILKTDKAMISDAVTKCLNHASLCGFASVSLPAVGTGHLKKDAKQSAEILYGCIKEYRKQEEKSLKLIRIVILQENVFADFNKAFSRKDPSTDASVRTSRTTQRIALEIAAESTSDITRIKQELRKIEEERRLSKTIETREKLDDRKLEKIYKVQDQYGVRIECQAEIGFMRISGLAENVANACDDIHNKIHAWETERHHTDASIREVQWFYYEGNKDVVLPEKYADHMSAEIEKAYKNNELSVVVGDLEETKFKIIFKDMTETCLTSNETMKVYRRPCEAFPLPHNWQYQPIDCLSGTEHEVHCVNLDKQDDAMEYDKFQNMFKVTMPNSEIVNIERVQNPRLYQIYEGQKIKMSNGGNEMRLFHGTAKDTVEKINSTGFNRAYCGKNAVRFGKGAYFAKNASYSARKIYAVPDDKGLQYIYIARVLVGKYTKGKEGILVPPPIDENIPTVLYDSVADDVTKPNMYVIFYDYQSYPEYLITFK